ncbi:hypothetical protein HYE53_01810 [Aggregatibacter actinomycetemcomitans]|uniref:hypothetical protein n=1 Tax=Aggregatibacter actinomycetemcomitans TaxID=714 RepID=UPI00197B10F5|nr:hypothetical protein [Aggregatibacter actinomycetemcomitans]MBN6069883.1 hypothetical protein [Aggregatibacter actinomycetemcomitans]
MSQKLRVPCAYQGGKQRIASQIVDILLQEVTTADTTFYDFCCGSGAISIELVNRGIKPSQIVMLDISSWGRFWSSIGKGTFDKSVFERYLSDLPSDKTIFRDHVKALSQQIISDHEGELYPILQACSFGGKQIWRNGNSWGNASFRNYWKPTKTSVRRSPANPMQPSPPELQSRIYSIIKGMKGITCLNQDIMSMANITLPKNSIVYIDPPYQSTTGYAFDFDVRLFINSFKKINNIPVFVSESMPLNDTAIALNFSGSNGGISGIRKNKHQEWLSRF